MATIDVIHAVRNKVVQFPAEQLPPWKAIAIQFCGELLSYSTIGDLFPVQNNTGLVCFIH
jgi:hypothetical protein